MTELPRLDLAFDDAELELGRELFAAGGVEVTEDGAGGLWEARVRHFKRNVWVWIRRVGDRWEHGCDCPHFEETGKGCEHLHALLCAMAPEEEATDDVEGVSLRPRYVLLAGESEREGLLRLTLLDEDGAPLSLTHEVWADVHEDEDVEAIRRLAPAAGGWQDVRRGGGFVRPRGPWSIPGESSARIVAAVLATGRARLGGVDLATAPGTALDLCVWSRSAGGEVELAAGLVDDGGAFHPLEEAPLALAAETSWAVVGAELRPVRHRGAHAWIRTLRRGGAIRVAGDAFLPFLARLEAQQPLPRIADAQGLLPLADDAPRGGVSALGAGGRWHLDVEAIYGELTVPWARPGGLALDVEGRRQYVRDRAAEDGIMRRLLDAGAEADVDVAGRVSIAACDATRLLTALVNDDWRVRVESRAARPAASAPFSITTSGVDWFEVSGGLSVDGDAVPLASVLASLAAGRDRIEVGADTVALVPPGERARLLRLVPLLGVAERADGTLRVKRGAGLLAADLVGEAETDSGFEEVRARLESFDGMADVAAPGDLRAELRPYQLDGLRWLAFLDAVGLGGCLADEMGLGKTVQVIAEILRRNERGARGPHLVVAPRSLIGNWADELGRFAPDAEVIVHRGGPVDAPDGAIVLTTYGLLRNHVDALAGTTFDLAALDEAQAIKNRSSRTARAARRLDARGRVALSGTPIENRLEELWSLMEFTNPGLLGAPTRFASLMRLDETAARTTLRTALRPVLLRRTKEHVATDLPDLIRQTVACELTKRQRETYDRVLLAARDAAAAGTAGSPAAILEALLRLRQAACHAALVEPGAGEESGKLDVLLGRLEEARDAGRKALVFSQFTSLLDLVEPRLEARGLAFARLDGTTRDRRAPVERFQNDGACTAFLISLRAGGTGLNLTAADLVFILDPWWNPAVEAQAVGRAHRIGREGTVVAQRLVGRGTVEEKIIALQASKLELADAVMAADEGGARFTGEELAGLLA